VRRWGIGLLAAAVVIGVSAIFWTLSNAEPSFDGAPAWSPDSTEIVFASEDGTQSDLWIMRADGTARRQLTETPAHETAPAFSPDGRRLAFESDRDGNFEIYVMNIDGTGLRRLTRQPAADHAPAWSPDGSTIAFVSERSGGGNADVYVMKSDGTGVRRLTTGGQYWVPQFSPSGLEIAVQGGRDLYIVTVANGAKRRLTYDPQNGMSPTWSTDGMRLAFASTRRSRLELFTTEIDGAQQNVLLSMPGGSAMDPRWSPDGTRIAFVYVPQATADGGETPQPYAIYVMEVASQRVTRLSP